MEKLLWERLIDKELELRALKESHIKLEESYVRARQVIVELQDQVEALLSNGGKRQCTPCRKEKSASGLQD